MTAWQDEAKAMRKVAIDLKKIEPIFLESRQAISSLKKDEKKKPSASKKAVAPTSKAAPKAAAVDVGAEVAQLRFSTHGGHDVVSDDEGTHILAFGFGDELLQ